MKIQIENYIIETSEHGKYNLSEMRKWESKDNKEGKINTRMLAYGITLPTAIKRIAHMNLHYNPNKVSLQQFLVEYRNEYEQIKKLLEIERLK